jgi:hypothetical protein
MKRKNESRAKARNLVAKHMQQRARTHVNRVAKDDKYWARQPKSSLNELI